MKKIVSLILTALMLAAMLTVFALPAFAEEEKPLCLTSKGSTTIAFAKFPTSSEYKLEYSLNGGDDWNQAFKDTKIDLNDNASVCFKANGAAGMLDWWNDAYLQFKMSGNGTVAASGSVMSLMKEGKCCDYCFYRLFDSCTALTEAPELPATTLAECCYGKMFYDCTALTAAPALPATKLADSCCVSMFAGCTALTAAPVLPATQLAGDCYRMMFNGCTALTVAPSLPATKLADSCYAYMFYGCTALTAAPELPAATELAKDCYAGMFYGCTKLKITAEKPKNCHYNELCFSNTGYLGNHTFDNVPNLPAFESGKTYYSPHDGGYTAEGQCVLCHWQCPHENWENGVCKICQYECTHEGDKCDTCGQELAIKEENTSATAAGGEGSTLSEGSLTIIVGVAAFVLGLGVMFFIMKKKKPALASGTNEE